MSMDIVKLWDERFKRNIRNQLNNLFIRKRIDNFLGRIKKNSRIIDFGCGIGEKANYIKKKGFRIVGIDSSKEAINFAKRNYPGIEFYKRNVLSNNFKSASF
jgi:2-polyprenyl-3-methyl-5-hydroxy-6-metoxy-1,4-benzoquinol methylase